MALSYKVSFQWLPVFDKYKYRPLPVHLDFLQNAFDIIFLLFFIWYWSWGPLLVILYYVVETVISCLFTSLKWWTSNARLSEDFDSSRPVFKGIAILSLCTVVGIFSFGQITAVHDVLGIVMVLPSWEIILQDEHEFMIGVVAILLQQTMEYYKHQKVFRNAEDELVTYILTPVLRIFVQQFAVMLGILAVIVVSFIDVKAAAILIALMLGIIKLIFGQLQLVVTEK